MINEIEQDAKTNMEKSIEALKNDLSRLRTGRAHPSLLEPVMVSYYGVPTPLKQVASVTVGDSRTLLVTPWEKNLIGDIEKGITVAGLGLNPANSGDLIRVPLPPLTEERRRDITKVVKAEGENAKISVRNGRRDANQQLKEALKEKMITEDEERRGQERIQKITDQFVTDIDGLLQEKEAEVMAV